MRHGLDDVLGAAARGLDGLARRRAGALRGVGRGVPAAGDLLAGLTQQVTGLLHRQGLHAYTHATLVSPVHLKEDLAQTRKRGYSFDDEEHALGLRCVASCIYDEHREPFAAISISGPISRITDDRVTEFGAMVIKAAKEVTLAYGGVR